eukprot:6029754-Amphidinium_carterae.1
MMIAIRIAVVLIKDGDVIVGVDVIVVELVLDEEGQDSKEVTAGKAAAAMTSDIAGSLGSIGGL